MERAASSIQQFRMMSVGASFRRFRAAENFAVSSSETIAENAVVRSRHTTKRTGRLLSL
jgi:hypothetical protein